MSAWRDKPVRVTARYIPRFLWTTASIDVFLRDQCILRTGGQAKVTGEHSSSFKHGDEEHKTELKWGLSRGFGFPYQLRIDGVLIEDSVVRVENQVMIFIPAFIIVALLGVIIGLFYWLRMRPQTEELERAAA